MGNSSDEEAATITHAISTFETTQPVPSLPLTTPTTLQEGAAGVDLTSVEFVDGANHKGNSSLRHRAESQGVAPTKPACVDDDAVMTSVPRLPIESNPFLPMFKQFHTKRGVKKDNPSYTLLAMEWFAKNSHHVTAPSADRNV
jgi:hypothetical protein